MRPPRAAVGWLSALVAGALLTACAVPDQSQPDIINGSRPVGRPSAVSHPGSPAAARIEVYLVSGSNQLTAVSRPDPSSGLSTAVAALLAGPTSQEQAAGLSSAIPVGTTLNSVRQSGSTADLDFSDALASVSGREQLLAFAQIVLTADSLTQVDRVRISIAGQEVNAPEPNGTLAQGPVTKSDYASLVAP
ncbi:MAG TPA: GerMN domain-containing protein [Acidimicrobiales bacterium]|nr:GerMN domain-containing protein [Acidimicrobiales bacterium]